MTSLPIDTPGDASEELKPQEKASGKHVDKCSPEKCELINQIFPGSPRESWYCKTHKRPYWPNRTKVTTAATAKPLAGDKPSKNAKSTPVAPDSLDDLLETMGVKFRSSLSDEQFDKIKVDSEAAIRLHYRQRVLAEVERITMVHPGGDREFVGKFVPLEALLGIFGED